MNCWSSVVGEEKVDLVVIGCSGSSGDSVWMLRSMGKGNCMSKARARIVVLVEDLEVVAVVAMAVELVELPACLGCRLDSSSLGSGMMGSKI